MKIVTSLFENIISWTKITPDDFLFQKLLKMFMRGTLAVTTVTGGGFSILVAMYVGALLPTWAFGIVFIFFAVMLIGWLLS